jgi:hypothetical protein
MISLEKALPSIIQVHNGKAGYRIGVILTAEVLVHGRVCLALGHR